MAEAEEREAIAWQTLTQVYALAKEARAVGLDTMAYLLDMVALEARQHVVTKGE